MEMFSQISHPKGKQFSLVNVAKISHQKVCHEIICHFFISWIEAISGPLINRLKWFCLKIHFCLDIRKKFDSAQANTARSQQLKCPQIRNWLTLHGVRICTGATLCGAESNKFFRFLNVFISREFRIHIMIFRKNSNIFWKSRIG